MAIFNSGTGVNDLLPKVFQQVMSGDLVETRNGLVRRFPSPVVITHMNPWKRVSLCANRDANPFFHLYEAIWMLAGRNDVASLERYNRRMREFSDDGQTFHGAYGHRWRNDMLIGDQVLAAIDHLQKHKNSRRTVITMYSSGLDTPIVDYGKDIPCNTHLYLQIRDGTLEMTICNRSNDLIWGMLGANIVHFSILQEFLARHLKVRMGRLHQFSNDLHVYERHFDLKLVHSPYPEVTEAFDATLEECEFVSCYPTTKMTLNSKFLQGTFVPMMVAFENYKEKNFRRALDWARRIKAQDWRAASTDWLKRRRAKHVSQNPYYGE